MARALFRLRTTVVDIYCRDSADGLGNAEPYIWPVFFKIDGDSFAVEETGLIGFPVVEQTNGAHGNLGTYDVDVGDQVWVPIATGRNDTRLRPIRIDPIVGSLLDPKNPPVDIPAIAGVVVVLMEQDGFPDDIAIKGYEALVNAVHLGVAKTAASFQGSMAVPTPMEVDEAVAEVKNTIKTAVRAAVKDYMSAWQLAWYGTFGNDDDEIGNEVWTVTGDDFITQPSRTFSRRWTDDDSNGNGDWTVRVRFTNLDATPPDNTNRCNQIEQEIEELRDELDWPGIDINRRKEILQAIGRLRDEARRLNCPD